MLSGAMWNLPLFSDPVDPWVQPVVFTVVAIAVYFIPGIVADMRKHPRRRLILGLNVILGITVIGWFGLLGWACSGPSEKASVLTAQRG